MVDLTGLLNRMSAGDGDARREVLDHLYPEFVRIARSVKRWQLGSGGATQTAELVSESVVRLAPLAKRWNDHRQFLAEFCRAVRSVRVDRRRRDAVREHAVRELGRSWPTWVEDDEGLRIDVLDLEEQLAELEAKDPLGHAIAMLRFYGQLGVDDVAAALEVPNIKVRRVWQLTRARLERRLGAR